MSCPCTSAARLFLNTAHRGKENKVMGLKLHDGVLFGTACKVGLQLTQIAACYDSRAMSTAGGKLALKV